MAITDRIANSSSREQADLARDVRPFSLFSFLLSFRRGIDSDQPYRRLHRLRSINATRRD